MRWKPSGSCFSAAGDPMKLTRFSEDSADCSADQGCFRMKRTVMSSTFSTFLTGAMTARLIPLSGAISQA
ncbi:hypothetical protein D3C72_1748920 [compost metagenome]